MKKSIYAGVLGFTLAISGLTLDTKGFWIVFIPTVLCVSIFNRD